ncbi:phage tail sheath family protein [Pseudonocardia sp.]|uniref:phage tail sheath family protein n=1 Tax=Pseudonocardia sp. TaxID=60912 RepID=UPI003D130670
MPQYLAPGVYVEEVPAAVKPIAGVGTSTAGFIGTVADDVAMPLIPGRTGKKEDGSDEPTDFHRVADAGTAVLVDSWEAFKVAFGDLQDGNRILAHAVYGFFNNGGGRCWVTRVAGGTDKQYVDALAGFATIDEIALVVVPGVTSDAVQTAVLDHCESPYLQDRFAILDGRRTTTLTKAAIQGRVRDSAYGAVYYPWLDIGERDAEDNPVHVPPSGHVAGVYARVDTERGVHKAPANEVIRGALGVETAVGKQGQAGLNQDCVNVIRQFGGNVTVWGARTMAGKDSEWRYISSRRLFNYLRESIDEGTRWVVFEPNAEQLWSKIRRNVGAFLTTVWASGALLGDTPEQAFYVRCDETTNPAAVRDLGQVVTEIGVALVKPAEFVVFRISQWSGPA